MSSVPVFILGSPRNGTTWLANLLCLHSQIAGVQHRCHWGLHASYLLENKWHWGDLRVDHRFIRFLEQYASSDYFRLTGDDKDFYYRHRPANFYEFFFTLMDRFAQQQGKTHWVTKLDPPFLHHLGECEDFFEALSSRYKRFLLVGIQRQLPQVLRSYLNMEGMAHQHRTSSLVKPLALTLESVRYSVHFESIDRLLTGYGGERIRFESLKQDPLRELDDWASRVGLCPFPKDMSPRFPPNSSFAGGERKAEIGPVYEALCAKVVAPLCRLAPAVGRLAMRGRDRLRGTPCPLHWRLLRMEYMGESLAEEFERTGNLTLKSTLLEPEDHVEAA